MAYTIADVPERERFEARTDSGEVAGVVTYQLSGNIIVYTHTEVDAAFAGLGVGSAIARAVMEDARAKRRTVVPVCPFLAEWLAKHTEFEDIVAGNVRKVK